MAVSIVSMSLSVSLSVSLYVSLYVSLSVCVSVCVSVCISVRVSVCVSVHVCVCLISFGSRDIIRHHPISHLCRQCWPLRVALALWSVGAVATMQNVDKWACSHEMSYSSCGRATTLAMHQRV